MSPSSPPALTQKTPRRQTDALQSTILVVDDNPANRDMLFRRLARKGYDVLTAEGGESCLATLEERSIQLVLLDIEMPGMDGVEVLKRIRHDRTRAQLPVIMVTARSETKDVVDCLDAGANDYVTKPIEFQAVLARVRTQLELERAERGLRESEQRYALAARGANDGLWDWDLIRDEFYFSPRWKAILGIEGAPFANGFQDWLERVHPEDADRLQTEVDGHLAGRTPHLESEHRVLHADGNYRWVSSRGLAIRDGQGRATRIAGSLTDITDSKVSDPLTRLPNKLLLLDRLEHCISRVRRRKSKFAVLSLDVDRFSLVNDSLGHPVGDQLLISFAKRLETCVRASDTLCRALQEHTFARLGGDEFTLLLEEIEHPGQASSVAARLLETLKDPFTVGDHEIYAGSSIGIAIGRGDASAEAILRDADTALNRAKARGGAVYEVFDAEMRTEAVARLRLETELRRAIERGEFVLHYQPIVSFDDLTIRSFEALIRWPHPDRGLVSPMEFIPLAEQTGLIVPIGRWVVREVCRQIRAWRDAGVPSVTINVNLCPSDFEQDDLIDSLKAALAASGVDAKSLKLEITENLLMENAARAAAILDELRQLGMGLAIDDFGAGYSSMSYLQSLPTETVKIDRSFVMRLGDDDDSRKIVRAMIDLAHNLGMDVVAEGVETDEQAAELKRLGCDMVQGFLYSRPVEPDAAESVARDGLPTDVGPSS